MSGRGIAVNDEQVRAVVPAGRRGTVEDIASAVCYLASDEAGYITGHAHGCGWWLAGEVTRGCFRCLARAPIRAHLLRWRPSARALNVRRVRLAPAFRRRLASGPFSPPRAGDGDCRSRTSRARTSAGRVRARGFCGAAPRFSALASALHAQLGRPCRLLGGSPGGGSGWGPPGSPPRRSDTPSRWFSPRGGALGIVFFAFLALGDRS